MRNRDEDAMNYVIGTNELENIRLSKDEVMDILKEIQSGKKDSSFLYELVKEVKRRKEEVLEENHGRGL